MRGIGLEDVIAAISTPPGAGGIGIVRLSGKDSILVADKVFRSKSGKKLIDKKSHTVTYGVVIDGESQGVIDEVLALVMKEPNSYTKENIVELDCHGGAIVVRKVLEAVLNAGARLAEPGEFTKRAFLNGRIDLSQAEAVIDLIQAKTDLGRQAAVNQLEGRLKTEVKKMRDEILNMIASIEAVIDYPEHDIEEETYHSMEIQTKKLLGAIEKLLASADRGKLIREGLQTVIVGKPNVGKSSLLNWFLEEERAIVTDIPGTTRDTVEEMIQIGGIPIKLVDTAGIRETGDRVEKIGVEKSKEYANQADLILLVIDSSKQLEKEDLEILSFVKDKKRLILLNKTDLEQKIKTEELEAFIEKENIIPISIKENEGLELLVERLQEIFFGGEIISHEDSMIGNVRHKNALYQAKEALARTLVTIETKMPEDFISMDLQEANQSLGEITGDMVDEEIIDRIFTKFCLGK